MSLCDKEILDMSEITKEEVGTKLLTFMEENIGLQVQIGRLAERSQANTQQINRLIVKYGQLKSSIGLLH